jgi:cytochrome c oxidase subunit 3
MTTTQTTAEPEQQESAVDDAHESHGHVAHHFESAQQQFDAGKLGIWLFLITEVLFFSGLFLAYAVYRRHHPEVFVDAHKYLNTTLGAVNTIVLLTSSLTMAWAVRCAQLGQHRLLGRLIVATLACASLFLGIKAVEYSHKWGSGLLWAGAYAAAGEAGGDPAAATRTALLTLSLPAVCAVLVCGVGYALARRGPAGRPTQFWAGLLTTAVVFFAGVAAGEVVEYFSHGSHDGQAVAHAGGNHAHGDRTQGDHAQGDHATVDDAKVGQGVAGHTDDAEQGGSTASATAEVHGEGALAEGPSGAAAAAAAAAPYSLTGVFFSIYYAMTGVHAVHILAGMGVMVWLLWRSLGCEFGPEYFGPVDYVGLYWHLVDLVWIYLFPLLYLIR